MFLIKDKNGIAVNLLFSGALACDSLDTHPPR